MRNSVQLYIKNSIYIGDIAVLVSSILYDYDMDRTDHRFNIVIKTQDILSGLLIIIFLIPILNKIINMHDKHCLPGWSVKKYYIYNETKTLYLKAVFEYMSIIGILHQVTQSCKFTRTYPNSHPKA